MDVSGVVKHKLNSAACPGCNALTQLFGVIHDWREGLHAKFLFSSFVFMITRSETSHPNKELAASVLFHTRDLDHNTSDRFELLKRLLERNHRPMTLKQTGE